MQSHVYGTCYKPVSRLHLGETNFAFAPSGLDTVRVSNAVQGLSDEAEYSKKFLTGVKICASIANNLSVSQFYKRESSKT